MDGGDAVGHRLEVQGGDVREADDPAGGAGEGLPVDVMGDAGEAVAATGGDERLDARVEEPPPELGEPALVAAGEVAVAGEHRRVEEHAVALPEPRHAATHKRGVEGARACEDGHRVAGAERRG